jgi:hypothetical protein
MSSKASSKRARIDDSLQRVISRASCPKAAIARVLNTLHEEGLLIDGVVEKTDPEATRKELSKLGVEMANRSTPFGKVIQSMHLETTPAIDMGFLHPMALVYYLSQISKAFGDLMSDVIAKCGNKLRIVMYIDECRPGNVLRADKGRAVQCLYWTFVDMPDWFLCRQDAWFVFTVVRSKFVNTLPAGVSTLMKHVVRCFFPPSGPSFATSAAYMHNSDYKVYTAELGGFLGDEKGLKEVFSTKGPGGTRPCLTCKNIVQFLGTVVDGTSYLQNLNCPHKRKFDRSTDAEVYQVVDKLAAAVDPNEIADMEQTLGVNRQIDGMLFDVECRKHVLPISHWLRDWMHVLCVAGCANIEIQQILLAVKEAGIALNSVSTYCSHFVMPKQYSKVHPDWFTNKRMGRPSEHKDGWKGSSSEILQVMPLIMSFLEVVVEPTGALPRHVECFRLLHRMLALMCSGPSRAAGKVVELQSLIDRHAALFGELYDTCIKPKYHHLFHLPDHAVQLGKLLSCFVTERKHRTVKGPAASVYGNFEKAMLLDLLHRNVDVYTQPCTFIREYLERPVVVNEPLFGLCTQVHVSKSVRLVCGFIRRGDLLLTVSNVVGEFENAVSYVQGGSTFIYLQVGLRRVIDAHRHSKECSGSVVVEASEVLGPVIWCVDGPGIRVLPPVSAV